MSSPRELQEVQAVLLNITEDIGRSFTSIDRRFQQLLEQLYKTNQEMLKENQLASLQGEMHAVPTKRFHTLVEKLNKEAVARNEQIKVAQAKLRQLQESAPASPADAKQAKALERQLNDLTNHNAELVNLQQALLKSTFVTGQSDADKDLSRHMLVGIQNQIGIGINHNKVLQSEFKAKQLESLGITMKTGTTAQDRQTMVNNAPKVKGPGQSSS